MAVEQKYSSAAVIINVQRAVCTLNQSDLIQKRVQNKRALSRNEPKNKTDDEDMDTARTCGGLLTAGQLQLAGGGSFQHCRCQGCAAFECCASGFEMGSCVSASALPHQTAFACTSITAATTAHMAVHGLWVTLSALQRACALQAPPS